MSANFIVEAEVRTGSGTSASRRVRREGKVPVVVYGGGEDEQYLLVDLLQLHVGDDLQRAILRDVQMHPYKQQVMHLDFQRVSRKDKITMTIPLHFIGEEEAPGVKSDNGIMSHSMTSIDISCLGSDLPEYVEVDVSALGMGDSVSLGDVKLPEGVEFASTVQDSDLELSIASVLAPKKPQTEEPEEGEEVEGEEGEEGAEAAEAAEGGADSKEGDSKE